MTLEEIAKRLVAIEAEMSALKAAHQNRTTENARHWFTRFSGSMANDPGFEEMIKLGKEWRDAQRDDSALEAGAA